MGPDSVAAQPLKLQLAEIRTMIAALEVAPRLDIWAKETHREKEDQEQNRENEGPGKGDDQEGARICGIL